MPGVQSEKTLKPCPFCGGKAEFKRVGTNRASCIVECTECGCSLESNEAAWCSGQQWNQRVPEVTTCAECQEVIDVNREFDRHLREESEEYDRDFGDDPFDDDDNFDDRYEDDKYDRDD